MARAQVREAPIRFRVVASEEGLMLRQLLSRRLELGVDAAAALIRAGGLYVDNVRIRLPMVRVAVGERITVYRGAAAAAPLDPAALVIVHRGDDFVVVDKPAGVPATATRGSARGTVAEALVHRLGNEGVLRPYVGAVRPIPAAASGLVLFTVRGQDAVSQHRAYLEAPLVTVDRLLVSGAAAAGLRCAEPVLLTRSGRLRLAAATTRGAIPALTEFTRLRVIQAGDGSPRSLLEATALRGMGAQAEVHSAALGYPPCTPETGASVDQEMTEGAGKPAAEIGEVESPGQGAFLHRLELTLTLPGTGEVLRLRRDNGSIPPWARSRAH